MLEKLDSRLMFAARMSADPGLLAAPAIGPDAALVARPAQSPAPSSSPVIIPTPAPIPAPTPAPTPLPNPTPASAGTPTIQMNTIAQTVLAGQAFHVEASSTVIPGYQVEDAKFEWNFGDPAGRWNKLVGFNSAHIYETPGQYTATLTVTAPSGKKATQSIGVNVVSSAYSLVFVSAAGSDANNGSSPNAAVKTLGKALALAGNNSQILLNRGDVFPITAAISITRTNFVIGSYGTGIQPTLMYSGPRSGTPNMLVIEKASTSVLVQGLTFDSVYTTNFNEDGMPHGIVAGGTATTIRDNTFLNLAYGINANFQPRGLLVMDNTAPLTTGLRAYFVWCQGSDLVIVGNSVANSTRQHNIRSGGTDRWAIVNNTLNNLDRTKNGDSADVAKGTIVAQRGSYAYVAGNKLRGPVGVGPLGQADGLSTKGARFTHATFENNVIFSGGTMDVHHGASNITIRNNVNYVDEGAAAYKLEGWSGSYGRGVSDIVIDHNIAITQGKTGQFLWLLAGVDGVTLTNNTYIAPNLTPGSASTAAVYVALNDLSSFRLIDNNTWPSTVRGSAFARGGMAFVGVDYTSINHKTPAEWNALDKVGDDIFADVVIDAIESSAITAMTSLRDAAPKLPGTLQTMLR